MALSLAAATAIAGGLSAAGSIGSSVASGSLNSTNRKWQTSEREKSQAWQEKQTERNMALARDFVDWEQMMYSSPSAQMRQLKEANLNPDLVYQNGPFQSVSSSMPNTPTSSSAPSASTFMPDMSGLSSAGSYVQNALSIESQRDLNKALAREADTKADENIVLTELHGEQVNFTRAQTDWMKEDKKRIVMQVDNMIKEGDKLLVEIDNLKKQGKMTDQEYKELIETYDTRFNILKIDYRKLKSELDISEQEADYLRDTFAYRVLSSLKDTEKKISDASIAEFQADIAKAMKSGSRDGKRYAQIMADLTVGILTSNANIIEKQFDLLDTYGAAHEVVNMVTAIFDSAANAVNAVKGTKISPFEMINLPSTVTSPKTVKGFSR